MLFFLEVFWIVTLPVTSQDTCLGEVEGYTAAGGYSLPYLKLTDHLDYLGFKLYANYGATRRENGEILKAKVLLEVSKNI